VRGAGAEDLQDEPGAIDDLVSHAFSRLRCCTGVSLPSTITRRCLALPRRLFRRSTTPFADKRGGVSRRNGAVFGQPHVEVESPGPADRFLELGSRSRSSPRVPDA